MPTTITTATHADCVSGSPEKRLDVAPDGTLWAAVIDVGRIRFFSSSNNGSTWVYSGVSDLSLGSGQDTAVPSFVIDADGYAHVSFVQWQRDPQNIIYARGVPVTGGGWSWTTKTISPAGGRVGVDSDLIAFRNGTGWVAWVAWTYDSGVLGAKVSKIDISASGVITVASVVHGPSINANAYQIKSLSFAHTGDGRTPATAPHLYLAVASASGSTDAWLYRSKYESGSWTWETPVTFDTGVVVPSSVMCSVFDGTRAFVVWAPSATALEGAEWNGSAGSVTARNPPALPGGTGNIRAISLAVDPSTADVYLVAYGQTSGNIIYVKFTRATTSWGSWTTAQTRSASSADGQLQLVRYPPRDSIDMVYAEGSGPYTVKGSQLLALTRAPSAPVLVSPANGAQADLASGATFAWQYSAVSPGDTQQAWAFRRTYGAGPTVEYWNASSQTWSGTIVWNTTDTNNPYQATFVPGKWTTGTTYSWSVRTRSSTGADSSFATDRSVTAVVVPVVTVTAPNGIYYGESTPLVQWTYTSTKTQRDYQVRIVATSGVTIDPNNPGPAQFDSGVVTSAIARNLRVTTSLTDGTAYRAYVRCTDADGAQSTWSYSDFTLSLQPPSGPLVEIFDEVSYDTGVPRMRLSLLARSNFLTAAAARGQSNWEIDSNITLTAQPDDSANQLEAGLKLTSTGSGTLGARTAPGSPPTAPPGRPQPAGPLSFPVVEGLPYTALAHFKTDSNVRAGRCVIRWYDADDGTGSLISESIGDQITTGTTSYVQAHVTSEAPEGAVLARMCVQVLGATAAGEIYYVSRLSFHPGRDLAWQAGGYADTQTLAVERSVDGGATWAVVTDRVKPDIYQRITMSDREMPFGLDVQYRAVTNVDVGGGSILTSAYSPIATFAVENSVWAIRDRDDEALEFNALVTGFSESDEDDSAVHWPAGREYPVIDTEGIRAPRGSMTLYVKPADVDTVVAIVRTTKIMVVQSPIGRVYYMRLVSRSYEPKDVAAREIDIAFYRVEP
jgi:hypothetical protein